MISLGYLLDLKLLRIQVSPATKKFSIPLKPFISPSGIKGRSNYLKTRLANGLQGIN